MKGRYFAALFLALSCAGCLGIGAQRAMTVYDQDNMRKMMLLLKNEMHERGIVSPEGTYYSPIFAASVKNAGKTLFQKLSPAFRFPDADPSSLPLTFENFTLPSAVLAFDKTKFTLEQGLETAQCCVLAETDWNGDGTKDWLAVFRISRKNPRSAKTASREFFLAIPRSNASVLNAEVLAVTDTEGSRRATFKSVAEAEQAGIFRDTPAVDAVQGQQIVIDDDYESLPPESGDILVKSLSE